MPSEKRPSKLQSKRTNQAPDERSARAPKAAGKKFAPKPARPTEGEWADKPKPMKRGEQSFGNAPRATGKPAAKGKSFGAKSGPKRSGGGFGVKPKGDWGKPLEKDDKPKKGGKPTDRGAYVSKDRSSSDRPERPFGDKFRGSDERPARPYGDKSRGGDERPERPYGAKPDNRPGRGRPPGAGGRDDRPRGGGDKAPYAPRPNSGAGERVRRSESGAKRGPKDRPERDPNELSEGAQRFVKFVKSKPEKSEKSYDEIVSKQDGLRKGRGPKKPPPPDKERGEEEGMRLNKYLAHSGVAARRKADEHIGAGHVKVNGEVVREMGHRVMPGDKVTFMNSEVKPARNLVYVLLNKPKDFITTSEDEKGRRTVMELIASATDERIYPVGRLDRQTTGLLLFTNDGELAQKLTHPSFEMRKVYAVTLDKPLHPQDLTAIKKGLTLEDGLVHVDEVAYVSDEDKKEIGIELHVGKNRIVRRIFEHLGYEVVKLDRVMYAGLTKKDLPRGRYRLLDEREIIMLKHFKG